MPPLSLKHRPLHIPSGLLCALAAGVFAAAAAPPARDLADQTGFQSSVQPFVAKTCYGCHSAKIQSGGLNLQPYINADAVSKDRNHWGLILDKLRSGQMPPPGMPRPAESELKAVPAWISNEFDRETRRRMANAYVLLRGQQWDEKQEYAWSLALRRNEVVDSSLPFIAHLTQA